ncbi:MAG: ABC transporter substrate-binding protein [Candidatus Wallbacteria bacterium]|nr:ABC transporter substrate-binding protein [Candidatus Wallbacteria bacterium]
MRLLPSIDPRLRHTVAGSLLLACVFAAAPPTAEPGSAAEQSRAEESAPASPWSAYRPPTSGSPASAGGGAAAPAAQSAPAPYSDVPAPQGLFTPPAVAVVGPGPSAPAFLELPAPLAPPAARTSLPGNVAVSVVRLGFVGPLMGHLEPYGLSCRRGIELALKEANADAEGPARFELVAVDDHGDEVFSSAAAVGLVRDPAVVAILGALGGAVGTADRVAGAAGCPQVPPAPAESTPESATNRWRFRNLADDLLQGALLARYLFDARGLGAVALLHDDSGYGRGGARVIRSEAASRNRQLAMNEEFPRVGADFARYADAIVASRAEAVVCWGAAESAAGVCRALAARGARVLFSGGASLVSPAFVERAGVSGEGVVVAYPPDAARRYARERLFQDRFRSAYGQEPDFAARAAFEAAARIVAAVRRTGPDRERVRNLLARDAGRSGAVETGGDATTSITLAVLNGGRFVPMAMPRGVR